MHSSVSPTLQPASAPWCLPLFAAVLLALIGCTLPVLSTFSAPHLGFLPFRGCLLSAPTQGFLRLPSGGAHLGWADTRPCLLCVRVDSRARAVQPCPTTTFHPGAKSVGALKQHFCPILCFLGEITALKLSHTSPRRPACGMVTLCRVYFAWSCWCLGWAQWVCGHNQYRKAGAWGGWRRSRQPGRLWGARQEPAAPPFLSRKWLLRPPLSRQLPR